MNSLYDEDDDHLDEERLTALVDEQVDVKQASGAGAHIARCAECEQRFLDLQRVVSLLHALPTQEVPRSFTLSPRGLAYPPNIVRLQRWYAATRVAAASLAAVFVFLVLGTLYVDATTMRSSLVSAPPTATAPSVPTLAAPAAAVQRAAAEPASTAPAAAGGRPATSAQTGDSTDQVAAATSVRPLPTLAPTPLPPPVAAASAPATSAVDPAAAWRLAASIAGVLAALIVLVAVALRHRLRTARAALIFPLE
jgi:hypothetical protein